MTGELLQFIERGGCHPGMGEVNNEFVPGHFRDDTAANYVEGPDVGMRDEAPDFHPC